MDERRAALQASASGAPLEQVIVLETNGPVQDLVNALENAPGFSWLAEEMAERDPDLDFHDAKKPSKTLSARLYMIMTNQEALEQLLVVWKAWQMGKRGSKAPIALKLWRPVFACLRDVRRWGIKDRIEETGIREDWNEAIAMGATAIPVELELWHRSGAAERSAAEARVRTLVEAAGGAILDRASIPAIGYHAVLAEIPRAEVEGILNSKDVGLVAADDLRLLRPTPQMWIASATSETLDAPPDLPAPDVLGDPVVALLDGLPIENHRHLSGRLTVDDPDDFGTTYPLADRRHGTAMASLILHGDLSSPERPLTRRLYVRPILRPRGVPERQEMAPRAQLWVDLIHRAVQRMMEGSGDQRPVAPTVRIVNLSVGDTFQPFLHSISPLARLLDWLAWKYRLLFVVSAGNHPKPIEFAAAADQSVTEAAVIKALHADHRNRRLLAPAEALNALTVGGAHEDEAGTFQFPSADQRPLVASEGLPSPISALGRGFRKAVKPDVLAPGGRAIFTRSPDATDGIAKFDLAHGPKLPGQKVASPGSTAGALSAVMFQRGTSNAAALATRAGAQVLDALDEVLGGEFAGGIQGVPRALVTKALLVHSATWDQAARGVVEAALRTPKNRSQFRDLASAFLGYGRLRSARAVACAEQRVTLIGGGSIRPNEQLIHKIPLPSALHSQSCFRRLTVTLAWFTPINPARIGYRGVLVRFAAPRDSVLLADGVDVDGNAVRRGTVQHEVLEGNFSAMNIGLDETIDIPVTCFEDAISATTLPEEGIPYALAVTVEVAPETGLPIYEEVRARVQPIVRIQP